MSDLQQGCSPSECGTKPACAGCSHNHNQAAETAKKEPPKVRKVIGVVSGKGGVGKSLVSGELAVMLSRMGYRVGVLDADITGPSIPRMFGIHDKAFGDGERIFPAETEKGIEVMSINLRLDSDDAPVIWRGPVIAGAVKQFWEDVAWGELDVMVIDMPPGTGDVPLTVFQSIPLDGVVVVSTPQDLVGMIVRKAVNMANEGVEFGSTAYIQKAKDKYDLLGEWMAANRDYSAEKAICERGDRYLIDDQFWAGNANQTTAPVARAIHPNIAYLGMNAAPTRSATV